MRVRQVSARFVGMFALACVLASLLPAGAGAARTSRVASRTPALRGSGTVSTSPSLTERSAAAKRSKDPLKATVTSGSDAGTMTVTGGVPPFTVSLLTDSGPQEVYSGTLRTIKVPLLAGKNEFRVDSSDLKTSEAAAWGTTKFWVANTSTRMVRLYDAAVETVTASIWVRGDDTTSAVTLRNIAVRPSDDHVFVVFSDNGVGTVKNRLVELDATGSFVATIPVPGSYRIQDVTFDASDNIYVSDRGTGQFTANRVTIVKLSPTGAFVDSTQTVLPANPSIGYPMVNLTTMLDYQPSADRLIARINSGTFAVMDPATLAIDGYRFSGDFAYTCMCLNTSVETSVTLYTGGSGFRLDPFFGKQSGFLNDARYLDPTTIESPFHDWKVLPTLPAITDVAVDTNDYVYTIQHDGANAITRAYVVNPDGSAVKTVDLPDGTRIAVVR